MTQRKLENDERLVAPWAQHTSGVSVNLKSVIKDFLCNNRLIVVVMITTID